MTHSRYRIGQIAPSSNITMETEIPALLRAREAIEPERSTFHSARMRMKAVTKEQLETTDDESQRCADACVQMPSLEAIQLVQDRIGKPAVSAAVATTYQVLKELGLKTIAPNAGELLNGSH